MSKEGHMKIRKHQVRWLVAVISGILVGANAGVELWHKLDLKFPWNSTSPPAIERVEPKANVGMSRL